MAGYVNPSALGLSSVALFRPSSLQPVMAAAAGEPAPKTADEQAGAMMGGGLSGQKLIMAALIVGALWYASKG